MKTLSTFNASLMHAARHFTQRTPRERILMLTVALAAVYVIADLSFLTPHHRQLRQWKMQTEEQRSEIAKINSQLASLSQQLASQSPAAREAELQELQRIISEADALLSNDDGGALRLSALLETMLRTTPGLKLVSLKTLPVVPLLPAGPQAKDGTPLKPAVPVTGKRNDVEPAVVTVHQHGVDIVIQGNFLALLPYLEKLRRYPRRLFWIAASLEVVQHPDALLHLTLTTLSEQKASVLE